MGMFKKVKSGLYSLTSFLVHGRYTTAKWDFDHHVVPPLSSTSTYRLTSAKRALQGFESFAGGDEGFEKPPIYIYERLDEPTRAMLEDRLAFAESGEIGVCFATGMAAIAASVSICVSSGEEIVSHHTVYGCTYSLFQNWLKARQRVNVKLVDFNDPKALARAITKKTRVLYFETPVNPTLDLIDIDEICRVAAEVNRERPESEKVRVIVDNTFATPFGQRPLEIGADMVVESLTKNICGFGTDVGGVVVAKKELHGQLLLYRKDFGGVLSSKSAWPILVFGLPSLGLRLREESRSAMEIARFLESHPKVGKVHYPGLESFPWKELAKKQMTDFDGNFMPGNMIYFILKGGRAAAGKKAEKLVDHIATNAYAITLAVSLGQIRTLIERPASMTHAVVPEAAQSTGHIDPGGIRLSVGIEEPADIIKDLSDALGAV